MDITKEWLEEKHIKEGISASKIAKLAQCSPSTIDNMLKKYGIKNQTKVRKYQYNQDFFKVIDTEEKAYWFGFIMADGYIAKIYRGDKLKQMKLRLVLSENDTAHIERFREHLDSDLPITHFTQNTFGSTYPAIRFDINSTSLCRDLYTNGLPESKSNNELIPSSIPKHLVHHFIRGLFDGDGSFIKQVDGEWSWLIYNQAGSNGVLLQIKEFFESQGVVFPNVHIRHHDNIDVLICSKKKDVQRIKEIMYKDATIYLDRKLDKYNDVFS